MTADKMKLMERENEILRTVGVLIDSGLDFIVVGGYGVSALVKHRFSVDCDIVIPKIQLNNVKNVLENKGYKKGIEKKGIDETYGGEFISYVKKIEKLPVTVDILVNSLVSRDTGASWSFRYIKDHSSTAHIAGIEGSVDCQVPERELLIAFKIHSARKTDIRDVVMLTPSADWEKVMKHLKRGDLKILKNQIVKIDCCLGDKNLVDSLKGVFTLAVDVNKQIKAAQKRVRKLIKQL